MLKKFATRFAVGAVVLMVAGMAAAQTESRFCNNALLHGDYAFTVEGYKLAGPPGTPTGPMRGVAMTTFDGQGGLTQIDSVNVNGTHAAFLTETPATGTYQVNSNCTGTFTLNFAPPDPRSAAPVTVDFVLSEGGTEIDTVVTAPAGALLIASHGKKLFWF